MAQSLGKRSGHPNRLQVYAAGNSASLFPGKPICPKRFCGSIMVYINERNPGISLNAHPWGTAQLIRDCCAMFLMHSAAGYWGLQHSDGVLWRGFGLSEVLVPRGLWGLGMANLTELLCMQARPWVWAQSLAFTNRTRNPHLVLRSRLLACRWHPLCGNQVCLGGSAH